MPAGWEDYAEEVGEEEAVEEEEAGKADDVSEASSGERAARRRAGEVDVADEWAAIEAERAAARERWWAEVEAAEAEARLDEGSRWRAEEQEAAAHRGGRARGRLSMGQSFSGAQAARHGGRDEVDSPVATLGRAGGGATRHAGVGYDTWWADAASRV